MAGRRDGGPSRGGFSPAERLPPAVREALGGAMAALSARARPRGGCAERRGAAPGSLRAALAAVPARPRLQLRPGAGSGGGGGNFPSSVAMRPG